jgi:hypothetical protein
MDSSRTLNRDLEAIGWGTIFIWWGVTELLTWLPNGVDAVGFGLILLGVNGVRTLHGMPTYRFSMILGVLALVWGVLDLVNGLLHLPYSLPTFGILLIVKERYECFANFIQDLPPNYRTVVWLSELGDLSNAEIAEVLGLSLDVVKIRLHRGKARLLEELRAYCKAEDWL